MKRKRPSLMLKLLGYVTETFFTGKFAQRPNMTKVEL